MEIFRGDESLKSLPDGVFTEFSWTRTAWANADPKDTEISASGAASER